MIYAKLRLGPEYAPNGHAMVELISQCNDTPFGRFRVRDLKSGRIFDIFEPQLELKWWDNPNEQVKLES